MGKPVMKVRGYKAEDIKNLLNSNTAFIIAMRLNMIYQVAKGLPSREVAKIHGVSFKQVVNWVHRFEEEGLDGLKDRPGRGRKASLSDGDLKNIRQVVLNESPEKRGYSNRKRWSGPILLDWINKEYKIGYKMSQVYRLLDKINVKFLKGTGYVANE
jgi:transposase